MPSTYNKIDYFDKYIKCIKLILLNPTIFTTVFTVFTTVFILIRFFSIL